MWASAAMDRRKQPLGSMADVVEALTDEFASTVDTATVVRVVRNRRRELAIAGFASTDMLHTRARVRLHDLVAAEQTTTDSARQQLRAHR